MKLTPTLRTAFATLALLPGALTACSSPADPADTATTGTPTNTGGTPTSTGGTPTSTTGGAATTMGGGTTGGPMGCIPGDASAGFSLLVDPANNYAFDSTVTLKPIKVAPNTALTFDWSQLTVDIQKQPINAAGVASGGEVQTVLLALLELTVADFEAKLNANEALNNYSKGALAFYPNAEKTADIYQFGAPGNTAPALPEEIDPYLDPEVFPPEQYTYAILVQDEKEPAYGVRMVQAMQLDPNEVNTTVPITNTSSDLVYSTDLTTVVPVQVPAGATNITADWTHLIDVAMNGLGDLWIERQVDEAMIGHYALTPQQLTEQFLGLENIASELYRGPVAAGAEIDLSTLVEETTAAPFPGISADGTWILALNCSKCTNPAPWFLTILTPCP